MSNYLSLVAGSGQVNTPPGSYKTVKEWILNALINQQSNILEIGCSTGFITIEMARYTGAKCCGLDLHEDSIKTAEQNIDEHVSDSVSFMTGDAGRLPFPVHKFSHVVIGGHLPFIPANIREPHITEAIRVIRPWGYLLTALYYYKSKPPKKLVSDFNKAVGTSLCPSNNYSYWNDLFKNQELILEHESINTVLPADEARIKIYLQQLNRQSRAAWKERLELFNENGKYINYFVRVYRRLPSSGHIMIQIPRGGIYRTKQISQKNV